MKRILLMMCLIGFPTLTYSEPTKLIFNPFTSKLDFITALSGMGSACPAFVLTDASLGNWTVYVSTPGNLVTAQTTPSTVSCTARYSGLVLIDPTGDYWTVSVNTSGNLITTAGGGFFLAQNQLFLTDASGTTWILKVSDPGNLVTS